MNTPFHFVHRAPSKLGAQSAIFLFHGLGSDENDLMQLVEPFVESCHIFSLQGPVKHPPGYAFYTFAEEGKPDREIFDKVIRATQQFIFDAVREYDIALDSVYVIGFNQGAVIAQTLVATLGNVIRGTVALSGFLPDFVENEYRKAEMDRAQIFIAHGEYDYVYPVSWGMASADFFKRMGSQLTYFSFEDGHGVTPEVLSAMHQFLIELLPKSLEY